MARDTLYIANFPETLAADSAEDTAPEGEDAASAPAPSLEDVLAELFGAYGDIQSIEFGVNERFELPYALVQMSSEKVATKAMHSLNGHVLNGHRLAISYPEPDDDVMARGLSAKQRKTAEQIVKTLGEQYRKPVRRVHSIVLLCGHSFALNILEEAETLFNGDGLMTYAGDRKRSLGGTFFTLANWRMSDPVYKIVHHRGGKLPNYQKSDDRVFYHLIVNPHPEDVEQSPN